MCIRMQSTYVRHELSIIKMSSRWLHFMFMFEVEQWAPYLQICIKECSYVLMEMILTALSTTLTTYASIYLQFKFQFCYGGNITNMI